MSPTRVGILLFALSVIAGPLYTVPEYSMVRNLISELAAQNTPRNWLMAGAFVALGTGIAIDGFRRRAPHWLPFMAFGILMALADRSPAARPGSAVCGVDSHGALRAGDRGGHLHHRRLHLAGLSPGRALSPPGLCAAGVGLRCLAANHAVAPSVQGATQRVMYALVFSWLWISYPKETPG